ncbi:MAG TPA: DUF192 domain-containing protein [Burkholderiales bacterium]|nr:DUF192 domain-containing protein [Burkholderiales bacterium]
MKKLLVFIFVMLSFQAARAENSVLSLHISGNSIIAEVANTPQARQRGLMHRKRLGSNHGMLFIFPEPGLHAMWMKNTSVPLSTAFLDERGVIINITDMTPFSEQPHYADAPARFALEMPKGWFSKRGINPGMKVEGLSPAPAGR